MYGSPIRFVYKNTILYRTVHISGQLDQALMKFLLTLSTLSRGRPDQTWYQKKMG
jgi:hypothetical protein